MKYNINFDNAQDFHIIDENIIKSVCVTMADRALEKENVFGHSVLKDYDFDELSFDILICDNETIHSINKDYRQKDCPTDVITFALFADTEPDMRFVIEKEINLGEIIISADKTHQQAQENDKTFDEELYFLLSHGILHLLGFDHLDDVSYEFMMETQDFMVKDLP